MESWHRGREEIFEAVNAVLNQVEGNLAAELNEETYVRIRREELRLLKENSAHVEKLAEHNARLVDELERTRESISRIDGLEEDNRRLADQLEQALKQQRQSVGTPAARTLPGRLTSTPGPEPASSANQTDNDEPNDAIGWKKKYSKLSAKYNKLSDCYMALREAKEKIEGWLKEEKQKVVGWNDYKEKQDGALAKRADKIKQQQKEISRLKTLLEGVRVTDYDGGGTTGETTPVLSEFPRMLDPDFRSAETKSPARSPAKLPGHKAVGISFSPGVLTAKLAEDRGPKNDAGQLLTKTFGDDGNLHDMEDIELPRHQHGGIGETNFGPQHASSTEGEAEFNLPRETDAEATGNAANTPASKCVSPERPEFVSSRRVNKRKGRHEPGQVTPARKIKIEAISSSPLCLTDLVHTNSNESMDLNDIGEKVDTPRKQRKQPKTVSYPAGSIEHPSQSLPDNSQSKMRSGSHDHGSFQDILQQDLVRHQITDQPARNVLQSRSTNQQVLPRTSDDRVQKKRRIATDEAVSELAEDRGSSQTRKEPLDKGARLLGLLSKPSPQKNFLTPGQRARPNSDIGLSKVAATPGLAREIRLSPSKIVSNGFRHPLQRGPPQPFKETPSPTNGSPGISFKDLGSSVGAVIASKRYTGAEIVAIPVPPSRNIRLEFEPSLVKTAAITPQQRPAATLSKYSTAKKILPRQPGNPWEASSDDEPLRARPLSKLRPQDFKVNPAYNQGLDYAYSEVVRGEARKCLTGCTKPDCCGDKFRLLAIANRNPDKPQTLSQVEADIKLLEDYMGDNAYKIRNMGKDEKEEMIILAKTRELSNKYGRHRHTYQRPASPPGFWRTEFPTTQEEIEDREKARVAERDLVAQRQREAMRPGGRFLFRDE